ncbi:MAG: D-alanyl-D-alanine carboxypeptidase family protein [Lachnospiraceae bacterium]
MKMRLKHGIFMLTVIFACVGVLCVINRCFPQWSFLVKDTISHLDGGEMPKKISDEAEQLRMVTIHDWMEEENVVYNQSMMLINRTHLISSEYAPLVQEYKDSGVYMNECVVDAYGELSQYIKDEFGEKLYIRSAYRSEQEQQEQVEQQGDVATMVGASEHQQGLGLDVYVKNYAGSGFIKHEVGQFVNEYCGKFGFIIRYPYYGEKETGIGYEPWHIRYVGLPHAEIIMDNRLTLEEYVGYFEENEWYQYGDYWIGRWTEESLKVPVKFESAVVSPDNMNGYWVTILL